VRAVAVIAAAGALLGVIVGGTLDWFFDKARTEVRVPQWSTTAVSVVAHDDPDKASASERAARSRRRRPEGGVNDFHANRHPGLRGVGCSL